MLVNHIKKQAFTSSLDSNTYNTILLTLKSKRKTARFNRLATNLPGDIDSTISIYHDSMYANKNGMIKLKSLIGTFISITNKNVPQTYVIERKISPLHLPIDKNVLRLINNEMVKTAEDQLFALTVHKHGFKNKDKYLHSVRKTQSKLHSGLLFFKKLVGFLK